MTEKEYQIREDIKKAIQNFDGGKLYESAISFFNVLDYSSNNQFHETSELFQFKIISKNNIAQ